jgi:hypothetical protein
MAVCCKNLTLSVLSSRSALSMLVGALFKKFGLFLNTPRIAVLDTLIYIYIYIYLTAIGLTPGGSGTVHIYTQTIHRIQKTVSHLDGKYLHYSRGISKRAGISHLKSEHTSQAHIHQFKNLRRNFHCCSTNIYFNQESVLEYLTPFYAKIKVPKTSPAFKHTQKGRKFKIENKERNYSCF